MIIPVTDLPDLPKIGSIGLFTGVGSRLAISFLIVFNSLARSSRVSALVLVIKDIIINIDI